MSKEVETSQSISLRSPHQHVDATHSIASARTYLSVQSTSAIPSPRSPPSAPSRSHGFPIQWIDRLMQRIHHTPIFQFYLYLFRTAPTFATLSLLIHYLLPILLEALPWWISRRQLSSLLRDAKNAISHRLIDGDPFHTRHLSMFLYMSIAYSFISTAEQQLRNWAQLHTRLLVRRWLVEKMLWSEVGALEKAYEEHFPNVIVQSQALDVKVLADINDTLQFFVATLPNLFRHIFTFTSSARSLVQQRHSVHLLAIVRPSIIGMIEEMISIIREHWIEKQLQGQLLANASQSAHLLTTIFAQLSEVQVNNLQHWQLKRLDVLHREEIRGREGLTTFLTNFQRILSGRNVLDFLSDVYVVKRVMDETKLSHEDYRRLQNDIDYTFRLFFRSAGLLREGVRVIDMQHRVSKVLDLPNFANEANIVASNEQSFSSESDSFINSSSQSFLSWSDSGPIIEDESKLGTTVQMYHSIEFTSLTIDRCFYQYSSDLPYALQIGSSMSQLAGGDILPSFNFSLQFERGKMYALIGENRSGKSTLAKVLCKLIAPSESFIQLNNTIPFGNLPRTIWRSKMAYISQRPFLFAGSNEDNIRVGNMLATKDEVRQAARLAGVFLVNRSEFIKDLATSAFATSLVDREALPPRKPWERRLSIRAFSSALSKFSAFISQKLFPSQDISSEVQCEPGSYENELNSGFNDFIRNQIVHNSIIRTSLEEDIEKPNCKLEVKAHCHDLEQSECQSFLDINLTNGTVRAEYSVPEMDEVLAFQVADNGTNVSGGFAQSIALARIFVRNEVQLIILDEAMSAMDAMKKRDVIIPNVLQFAKEKNSALIIITHEIEPLAAHMDNIYVMYRGRCVASGSHATLAAQQNQIYHQFFHHLSIN